MRKLAALAGVALVILALTSVAILLKDSSTARADDDHGDFRSQATPLQIGTGQITGVIDPTIILFDVDYFSFEALRGVRYTFVLELATVEDANILVVNSVDRGGRTSPGQTLSQEGNQNKIEWIARTTDTYFLEVSGTRSGFDGPPLLGSYSLSASGEVSLEDRHSENRDGSSPIVVDNVYQGAISPWTNQPGLTGSVDGGDDHDVFPFEASRGVRYTVDAMLGTAEGVVINFVSPTGVTETSNDGVGTSLQWISPASDFYYIEISGSSRFRDSVGTYSLKLSADISYQDRHPQSHAGATTISFSSTHQGAVSPEDDLDVFSFQATRGVRYGVRAELGTVSGIGLSVEELGGNSVATNSGVGTGLQWIAPANGTYFVVVSGSSQVREVVGTYTLIVDAETILADRHGETANAATAVSFGNEHRGAVSPANDRDYFSFGAGRGVRYSIVVALDTAEGVEIKVVAPNGVTQVSNGGAGTRVDWTASISGTYFIAISAPSQVADPIGTYALKVEADESLEDRHGDDQGRATPVAVGSSYQASISPEGDKDYFSFRTIRGVKYTFELTYDTANAVSLSVNSADGGPAAARNFGEGTDVVWIAPDSDDYLVAITGSPRVEDLTRTYSLKIRAETDLEDRHSDLSNQATRMILHNALAGAISPPDDNDYFFFDAEQGDEYLVLVELGTAEALRLTVTQALAGFNASNFGSGMTLAWQAPITGRYTLVVTASEQATSPVGTYRITVTTGDFAPTPTPEPTQVVAPTPTPTPPPVSTVTGPSLIVESRIVLPAGTVLVPVVLQEAAGLTSLSFNINYAPSVAEVLNVFKGSRLSPATFSYDTDVDGVVRVGFAATTGLSGGGSAAIVEFRVIGEQGASSLISLSEVLASDAGGGRLALDLAEGLLTVGQPMAGDGNGDGKITALDALIALRMSLRLAPENSDLDVNGDGRVTAVDARQILAMARPG